jgi:hypothetical protein
MTTILNRQMATMAAMATMNRRCNTMYMKQKAVAKYAAATATCISIKDISNSMHNTTMHNRNK